MFTVITAFIDAKYNSNITFLYCGTVIIDIIMWVALSEIFKPKG